MFLLSTHLYIVYKYSRLNHFLLDLGGTYAINILFDDLESCGEVVQLPTLSGTCP